jgi:hypothetical protein
MYIIPVISVFLLACLVRLHPVLYAYFIALTTEYDGNLVIKKEGAVKSSLERIIRRHGDYSMRAFNRKAISYKVRKTSGTTHMFYVISAADGEYHTLSFSATGKWAVSQGAWAMDTESDLASYRDYLDGTNRWEVEEIKTETGINTLLTLKNVLSKLRSGTTYYFRAKAHKNNSHDNCKTAVLETLVETGDRRRNSQRQH